MHDLIIGIVAAVVVVGGGGTGALVARGRRVAARRAQEPEAGAPAEAGGDGRAAGPGVAALGPDGGGGSQTDVPASSAAGRSDVVDADLVQGADLVQDDDLVQPDEGLPGQVARPRLRDRLGKARSLFGGYLTTVRSRDSIDATTWDDLEEALILADVGAEVTESILDDLKSRVKSDGITTPDQLVDRLRTDLIDRFDGDRELHVDAAGTNVWLFVGVNGVGKTTTIGKLGLRQRTLGHSIVMAAGDTFRAAAAEQLAQWADRAGTEIIRGNEGGDPGAVIFDAVQHAAARHADLVLADTAGRLHNKVNLMEELKKVRRVAERPPGHVSEVLLVIDATTGQNGLIQARQFAGDVGVTGIVLTKLDGTAKGGIAVAIQSDLGIPIKLVGVGEGVEDLIDFDPVEFVDALVTPDD